MQKEITANPKIIAMDPGTKWDYREIDGRPMLLVSGHSLSDDALARLKDFLATGSGYRLPKDAPKPLAQPNPWKPRPMSEIFDSGWRNN